MAWLGLLITVRWNYAVHERRQECGDRCGHWYHRTICNIFRLLPRPVAMTILGGIFSTIGVHIWNGYKPRT